tara:strand:- start:1683 stop:1862 length:180 start_codon:yes stop_codon:yes gene_type:complete
MKLEHPGFEASAAGASTREQRLPDTLPVFTHKRLQATGSAARSTPAGTSRHVAAPRTKL